MPTQRLERMVVVRVSEPEHAKIKQDAALLDTTVSEYLRSLARLPKAVAQGDERGIIVYNRELYVELVRLIRIWGYHYNHCLHALNTIAAKKFMYPDAAAEMFGQAMVELDGIEEARKDISAKMEQIASSDRIIIAPRSSGDDIARVRRSIGAEGATAKGSAL